MPTIAQTTKEKRLISELFSEDDTRLKKQRVRFDDYVEVLTEEDDDEEELDGTEEEEEEDVEFVLSIGEDGDFDYTIITTTATTSVAAAAAASASNHQPSQQDIKKSSPPPSNQENTIKITRPASPFAGSDRRLCEELYIPPASYSSEDGDCCPCCEGILNMMTLPSLCSSSSSSRSSITSWQSSLGNNLKIFIPSTPPGSTSSSDEDDDAAASTAVAGAGEAKSPLLLRDVALLTPLITPPLSPRREGRSSDDGLMTTADETIICEWPCNLTVDNAITSALELSL